MNLCDLRLSVVFAWSREFSGPCPEAGINQESGFALPFPFLVFLAGLTKLVQGVQRLDHPRKNVQDAGGVDELCILETRMPQDVPHEVLPRLQLLVTRRDYAFNHRPILDRD